MEQLSKLFPYLPAFSTTILVLVSVGILLELLYLYRARRQRLAPKKGPGSVTGDLQPVYFQQPNAPGAVKQAKKRSIRRYVVYSVGALSVISVIGISFFSFQYITTRGSRETASNFQTPTPPPLTPFATAAPTAAPSPTPTPTPLPQPTIILYSVDEQGVWSTLDETALQALQPGTVIKIAVKTIAPYTDARFFVNDQQVVTLDTKYTPTGELYVDYTIPTQQESLSIVVEVDYK